MYPKTVGALRNALACYDDTLDLETPVEVLIAVDPSKPFLLKIRHI